MKTDDFEPDMNWSVPPGWVVADFSHTLVVMSDEGRRVKQRDYLPSGDLPVVDQGEDPVGGYTDDASVAYRGPLPVIVFGDHTRRSKHIGFPFAVGADGVKLLRPQPWVDSRYAFYLLSVLPLPDRGYSRHFQYLRKFTFPTPPLPEQRRIVAKIEELFSLLDAGVAALERVRANLKRYRASVLKAAVEGRLTQEWRAKHPDTEPASVLLDRILQDRRRQWEQDQLVRFAEKGHKPPTNWQAKYKEPQPPDTTDLPELPEGWCWASYDSVVSFVTSGSRGWAQYYSESGSIFIRIGNLDHASISLDFADVQCVLPPDSQEAVRTRVAAGDILVSITADVGMIGLVPDSLDEAYINQHISLTRPVQSIHRPYVAWYLAAEHGGQRQYGDLQRGATKVGLGLDDIRAVVLPLPPLAEQMAIVAEVERRLSVVDEVEAEVAAGLKRAARLRQAILKRAFEGRLVPQDPNDEPASALLERIKAERANETPSRRTRKKQ